MRDLPLSARLSWFLGALFAVAAVPLGAAEREVPYRIGPETATSDCIGKPSTPVCAYETWLACSIRREPTLCARVGISGVRFNRYDGPPHELYYDILSVTAIPARVAARLPVDETRFKAGYVDIRGAVRGCQTTDDCTDTDPAWDMAVLRPVGSAWHIGGWAFGAGNSPCWYEFIDEAENRLCEFFIWEQDFLVYDKAWN